MNKRYARLTGWNLSRAFWISAAAGVLVNGFLFGWLLLKPTQPAAFLAVDNITQTIGLLLAALLCFLTFTRSGLSRGNSSVLRPSLLPAAVFLGLGILSECLGQATYTYYEQVLRQPAPFPCWADAGYLAAYPFLLLGIFSLASRPLSRLERSRILLDGVSIMLAVSAISWYFILGPTLLQGYDSLFAKIVGAAYPFADLVLVFCLLLLVPRTKSAAQLPALLLLWLGLLVIVGTDSIYDLQTLHNAYATGGLLDIGWPLGYTLVGLAVQALPRNQVAGIVGQRPMFFSQRQTLWRSLLAYALVLPVSLLVVLLWQANLNGTLEQGVYIQGVLLIGLILLRQVLVIRETLRLNAALQQANLRLESMATTDPLTELPNHRALQGLLEQESERARRFGRPLSLLFFDGDRFKRVNDTYGHAVGDLVLRELGERARSVLRAGDTIGRFGGEEFLVLLPETNEQEARTVAERLRAAVAAFPLARGEVEGGIAITVSIGLATYPLDGNTISAVHEQADQAMYWAKRLGRNQVRTAAEAERANRDAALKAATASALERRELVMLDGREPEQQVRVEQLRLIYSLMGVLDWREPGMNAHAHEVSDLVTAMARLLQFDSERILRVATAAFLHDIGKIALPDRLLQQPRSYFSEYEWRLLQQHAEIGAAVVEDSPWLGDLAPAIRHHHESWDGAGYPDGLAGEAIPLEARLIAIAEAFHAITSDRPYQKARPAVEALAELKREAGTQFDPALIGLLEEVLANREQEPHPAQNLFAQI